MTRKRVDRRFFAEHTVSELSTWTDFHLEDQGRLAEPMSYDAATDRYVPISWDDAFRMVGEELRGLESPNEASFYTSGRLGNEATFLYQLMARELGTNNLPDCSNMCSEASGRALQAALGTGKGTADLVDWEMADALFIIGVNAASNAPRMLTSLAEATDRGAKVVHINPLVEAGARETIIPHDFVDMALDKATSTSSLNLQVRPGGDMALIRGIAKATIEAEETDERAVDDLFVERYTVGAEAYKELVAATPWDELEQQSGLSEAQMRQAAQIYLESDRTVISWCLGVTQHEHGVDTVREIVNLLLLRGNLGREGAGPSPVRGHSNVQGNRTCGIDHRPSDEFLDRLAAACNIDPPREHGLDTIGTIKAMDEGRVKVFVGMGGNFALAAPDTAYTDRALRKCRLTVQVSTKLNRSHLAHGERALILPCLGRTEKDEQEHHDLLRQRPLPRGEEPPHPRLHAPRRHEGARHRRGRSRRHHGHVAGRIEADPRRLHRPRVQPAAGECCGLHARDERARRDRGLQHPERPAAHEEPQGPHRPIRGCAGLRSALPAGAHRRARACRREAEGSGGQ